MKCIPKGRGLLKILDKKLEGDKVYYLLGKARWRKWVDFEDLNEHLQLVIEYEQKLSGDHKKSETFQKEKDAQEDKVKGGKDEEGYQQKISQLRREMQVRSDEACQVDNMLFLNMVGKEYFFKVFYQGGHEQIMSNRELRQKHPQQLISFYENNIQVGQGECEM